MAKLIHSNHMIYFVILLVICGLQVHGVPYDNSITLDCLATPPSAQYGGGMVMNPELNEGLNGWTSFEDAKIGHVLSDDGNPFAIAYDRTHRMQSISQPFYLEQGKIYTFSAWVQVTGGEAQVRAVFKTDTGNKNVGSALARKGCWKMMKGGLDAKISGLAHLYFETNIISSSDVWLDSISLQSFTQQEWISHQQQMIQKVRKRKLRIQVMSGDGLPIPNATVALKQTRRKFPFGCAMNNYILTNPYYQKWFLKRFHYTTFENELKWYFTEITQGVEDYTIPDAMMQFAHNNKIRVRGHNVLWDDSNPNYQPYWVPGLSPDELQKAVDKRIESVVSRYKDELIHWDVVNENLNFDFFERRLNKPSSYFYDKVHKIDHKATPFLNDFSTIEFPSDPESSPEMYVNKINEMRACGYKGRLGIGLEGHFEHDHVDLVQIRTSIEYLSKMKLPIWITELDVTSGLNQAKYLRQIIRELHSHKYVRGMVLWGSMDKNGKCYRMCLTNDKYQNLPTGDVVDKFIHELKHKGKFALPATTDSNGLFEASVYHGDYEVQVMNSNGEQVVKSRTIKVAPKRDTESHTHRFTFDVEN